MSAGAVLADPRQRRPRLSANARRHRGRQVQHPALRLSSSATDDARPAIHRRARPRASARGQDARADRRLRRRLPALAGLSSTAPPGGAGGALPAFDSCHGKCRSWTCGCTRRCLVIDGEIAFVGGLNIGAENLVATRPKSPVRDCHFRVEGAIVEQIEQQFDDDWLFTTGEAPIEFTIPRRPYPARRRAGARDRLRARPGSRSAGAGAAVARSTRRGAAIRIATPYFLPDEQLVTRARNWRRCGAWTVDIVLPAVNNHWLVGWAAQAHIRPLLVSGCRRLA